MVSWVPIQTMIENTTTLTLSIGSLELLLSAITAIGWTQKRREIVAAGMLSDRLESYTAGRPIYAGDVINGTPTDQFTFANFRSACRAWERLEENVCFTDSEFQACVSCLRHFSDEKKLPSNFHGAQLLLAFKLSE